MKSNIWISVGFSFLAFIAFMAYRSYNNQPQGQWKGWRQFYSESQGQVVEVDRYENGYFRDLDKTGNPFDRQAYPNYVRCDATLLKEIEAENRSLELPEPHHAR